MFPTAHLLRPRCWCRRAYSSLLQMVSPALSIQVTGFSATAQFGGHPCSRNGKAPAGVPDPFILARCRKCATKRALSIGRSLRSFASFTFRRCQLRCLASDFLPASLSTSEASHLQCPIARRPRTQWFYPCFGSRSS